MAPAENRASVRNVDSRDRRGPVLESRFHPAIWNVRRLQLGVPPTAVLIRIIVSHSAPNGPAVPEWCVIRPGQVMSRFAAPANRATRRLGGPTNTLLQPSNKPGRSRCRSAATAVRRACARCAQLSVNTYSCWPSRMTSARLPDRSATTNSNPMFVGSVVMNETVPSSFLREATLLFHSPKSNVVAPATVDDREIAEGGTRIESLHRISLERVIGDVPHDFHGSLFRREIGCSATAISNSRTEMAVWSGNPYGSRPRLHPRTRSAAGTARRPAAKISDAICEADAAGLGYSPWFR